MAAPCGVDCQRAALVVSRWPSDCLSLVLSHSAHDSNYNTFAASQHDQARNAPRSRTEKS